MDFSLFKYKLLLDAFKNARYKFITFEEYCVCNNKPEKYVILRHDVDKKALNSLSIAKIENKKGIKSSYYFRIVPESNNPEIIEKIKNLGHEIGYHYEDMSLCKGDKENAKNMFEKNLSYFRLFYPIKTICMHGAPTSRYDGRDLWKYYNYHDFGIIGEPYFDIDFDKVFYLTDTGRCWNGDKYSIRDKVKSNINLHFHSTSQIIDALNNKLMPNNIMITTHPQRWTDNKIMWIKEFIMQSIKNQIKRLLIKIK